MTYIRNKKIRFQEVNINGPIYEGCSSSVNRYPFTKILFPNMYIFEFSQKIFPKVLK